MKLVNKSGSALIVNAREIPDGETFEVPDKKADSYLLVAGIAPAGGELRLVKKEKEVEK